MKSSTSTQPRISSIPAAPASCVRLELRMLFLLLAAIAGLSALASAQTGSGDFTIIALPDTQYYSQSYPQIYNSQTQWIANNLSSLNIKLVLGLEDIVEGGGVVTEWRNADARCAAWMAKFPI